MVHSGVGVGEMLLANQADNRLLNHKEYVDLVEEKRCRNMALSK